MSILTSWCRFCSLYMPGAFGGQKRTLDPLEPELQIIVNSHVLLGTESRPGRTGALKCRAPPPSRPPSSFLITVSSDPVLQAISDKSFEWTKEPALCPNLCKRSLHTTVSVQRATYTKDFHSAWTLITLRKVVGTFYILNVYRS